MWSRRARIIWFALDKEDAKGFHIKYPIACSVFRELLDSFYDLTSLLSLFIPDKQRPASHFSVHSINELVLLLMKLIGSITENEPYDLMNVSTNRVKFQLSVKNKPINKVTVL